MQKRQIEPEQNGGDRHGNNAEVDAPSQRTKHRRAVCAGGEHREVVAFAGLRLHLQNLLLGNERREAHKHMGTRNRHDDGHQIGA